MWLFIAVLIVIIAVILSTFSAQAFYRAAVWTAASLSVISFSAHSGRGWEPTVEQKREGLLAVLTYAPGLFAVWLTAFDIRRRRIPRAHLGFLATGILLSIVLHRRVLAPNEQAIDAQRAAQIHRELFSQSVSRAMSDVGISNLYRSVSCALDASLPKVPIETPGYTECFEPEAGFADLRGRILTDIAATGLQLRSERNATGDRSLLVFCHPGFVQEVDASEGGSGTRKLPVKLELLLPAKGGGIGKFWAWGTPASGLSPSGQTPDVDCSVP